MAVVTITLTIADAQLTEVAMRFARSTGKPSGITDLDWFTEWVKKQLREEVAKDKQRELIATRDSLEQVEIDTLKASIT